jgi:RNA recognition motif-containing protein
VVFEKEADATKALQLNGFKLLDNHLRVNMANKKNDAFSNKGTIFVGNLQFEATEAEIHDYFKQVGEILYVRKIANKGIAYVSFDKGVNIAKALKLDGQPFKGRNLRISRCESRDKQDKQKLFKKDKKTGKIVKQKVRRPHKMDEDKFMSGRANNNPIIKKIKETKRAKFNKFAEDKQLSKKELFRPGGKMDQNQRDQKRESFKKKSKFFGAKVDGVDRKKSKKTKVSKSIKQQKVIAKKLKSAAARVRE